MKQILIILICLMYLNANSQENTAHQWYFGENSGIEFNTGVPIAKTDGQIASREGCATVGDLNGNLLFYCDGQYIYNRNHQIMQNGSGLMGNPSATQSSIIVPFPGNDSLFYVFTVDAIENQLQNGLRYSIINMNLDGGLGGVTSDKNILLETPVAEKLTAIVHSNMINVWVIAHRWNTNEFVAYEVTPLGINMTPVISAIGSVHTGGYSSFPQYNGWGNALGYMKSNINGNKIAVTIYRMNKVELFDFNKLTGVIFNHQESTLVYNDAYGVEFSPSGDFLYLSQTTGKIYQFYLNQTNPLLNPTLINSITGSYGAVQLAPNGKLYIVNEYSPYITAINNPNVSGSGCNFVSNSLYLNGKTTRLGLPTLFYYKGFNFFTGSEQDTVICDGDSAFFENSWQTVAGTYYDTVHTSLSWDSIINTHLTLLTVAPVPIITENSGVLNSNYTTGNQWYLNGNAIIGAIGQQYQPFVEGLFQVSYNNGNGCFSFSDEYLFTDTGNEENISKNEISIYPNPFEKEFSINIDQESNLEIFDIKGSLIFQKNNISKKQTIQVNSLEKGVYLLQLNTGNDKTMRKLIIKK